eukprot:scaffold19168_cov107-Isochrysis_galbana.AAC.11
MSGSPSPADAFSQRVMNQVIARLAEHVHHEGLDPAVLAELRQRAHKRCSQGAHSLFSGFPCHPQLWMQQMDESRAAAVPTTQLARAVGDGNAVVPGHYAGIGAAVASGAQLEGVYPNARGSAIRRAGGPAHEQPLERLEGLENYSGGGYETVVGTNPPLG